MTSNSSYGYGLEYSTTEQILAAKRDMSGETHGTHVAGIATGSWDNVYKGIAPKSEIVLISVNGTEQRHYWMVLIFYCIMPMRKMNSITHFSIIV